MAVAFDAFSSVAEGTGNLSWTHTPVGTPRAVKVDIVENGGTNGVSGVTYGGVAMELVAVNAKTSGEAGTVITYFLGKNIPTGAQTVSVTVSDAVAKRAGATTVTAATATTCWVSADISIGSDSLANPASTLALRGKTCFVSLCGHSGQNAATGTTQSTGWTNRLEHDFGNQTAVWYTYNTIAATDVACGWTQTADDAVMVALAITEAPLATETCTAGLTESASKAVIFDARALPILITEAAAVTVALSTSDSAVVQVSSETPKVAATASALDSAAVQGGDVGAVILTSSFSLSVSDSLAVQESEAVTSSAATSLTDSLAIIAGDARAVALTASGALVVEGHDALTVQAGDTINDLFVFVPGNTQNFVVSDSLKVQLNGGGPAPIAISAADSTRIVLDEPTVQDGQFGVLDSCAVQAVDTAAITAGLSSTFSVSESLTAGLTDVSSIIANTILTVSDSLRVQAPEDVPDEVTALATSDSVRVVVDEPGSQQTFLGVLDSLTVQASGEVSQITGQLMFTVTDSVAVQASEVTSLGTCITSATDSLKVQLSDATSAQAKSTQDSVTAGLTDSVDVAKSIPVADTAIVQVAELASPIFNNFVDLTASDMCAVQAGDTVADLVSFLLQLTATDSLVAQLDDLSTEQDVVAAVTESCVAGTDEQPGILATISEDDTLKIGTTEAGLAIPLVTVNVTTFTDDTLPGFSDAAYLTEQDQTVEDRHAVQLTEDVTATIRQPSAETVAAALLESLRLDRSGALTETNSCGLNEAVRIAVTQFTTDDGAVQETEDAIMQPGYYFGDSCLVGVTEGTAQDTVVTNQSPETWNGRCRTEHRDEFRPGRYQWADKMRW